MKKHNNNSGIIRQGDVLLLPVKSIPNKNQMVKTQKCTLAVGEATGHSHDLIDAVGYADKKDDLPEFVEVKRRTTLQHRSNGVLPEKPEHDTLSVEAGTYQNVKQYEYAPAELRRVGD